MTAAAAVKADPSDTLTQLASQLQELGASVVMTGGNGQGWPAMLVGYGHRNVLLDVDGFPGSSAKFREGWHGGKIHEVSTLNQACAALGLRLVVRRGYKRRQKPAKRTALAKRPAPRGRKRVG